MLNYIKKLCYLLILIISTTAIAESQSVNISKTRKIILYYFDLVQSGNYESASGLWSYSTIEQANRLGINYEESG